MLTTFLSRSKVTIPESLISGMGLQEGDMFEIYETDGILHMVPIAIYPKQYIDDLLGELKQVKEDIKSGKLSASHSIGAVIDQLEKYPIDDDDPFYSETNQKYLLGAIQELKEGRVQEHELIDA